MDRICSICKGPVKSKVISTFVVCSSDCRTRARRRAKIDFVSGTCVLCSKPFKALKYTDQKYCGTTCSARARASLKKIRDCGGSTPQPRS